MELHTARLKLVASPRAWVRLSVTEYEEFAREIGARLSPSWPIDELEAGAPFVWQEMRHDSADLGWWMWWLVADSAEVLEFSSAGPMVIGYAGFKGPVAGDGSVELTYAIDPECRRRGYVSEAVATLLQWALSHPMVRRVIADTTPSNIASRRVLEKNGFRLVRRRRNGNSKEETLDFELTRNEGLRSD